MHFMASHEKKTECDTCKLLDILKMWGFSILRMPGYPGLIYSDSEGKEVIYSQPYLKHFSKMKRYLVFEMYGQSTSNKTLCLRFLEEPCGLMKVGSFFLVELMQLLVKKRQRRELLLEVCSKVGWFIMKIETTLKNG